VGVSRFGNRNEVTFSAIQRLGRQPLPGIRVKDLHVIQDAEVLEGIAVAPKSTEDDYLLIPY
jgi:hypothetical protein